MMIDWKALKTQKEKELPAAKEAHEKHIKKIVDKCEKNLFKLCKKQEAGTTVEYDIFDFCGWKYKSMFYCAFIKSDSDWTTSEKPKREVFNVLNKRISSQGIKIKEVEGWWAFNITLP